MVVKSGSKKGVGQSHFLMVLKHSYERVKIPLWAFITIFIITLIVVLTVAPEKFGKLSGDPLAITGNAVLDSFLGVNLISANHLDCYMVYDPVCGTNGVTYDNLCLLRKAGADFRHQGNC